MKKKYSSLINMDPTGHNDSSTKLVVRFNKRIKNLLKKRFLNLIVIVVPYFLLGA